MTNLNLTSIGQSIQSFFGQGIQQIARRTKFVQRFSKLDGPTFLQAIVFGYIENPEASLEELAQVCQDLGVSISAQGLDERINQRSVSFLKEMFKQAMDTFKNKIPLSLPVLQQFNGINILDSSVLALPESMQGQYPGCAGNGPKASLKIQLLFEFLYGNLSQIALQPGRQPDQSYRDYVCLIKPGSLNLMDLGYFCLDVFKSLMSSAYILSRFLPRTGLLTPTGEAIELLSLLQSQKGHCFEIPVLLGKQTKHQLPCRLIGFRLPQAVADRRRQKAKEKARRTSKGIKQSYLATLDWNLFVTNTPPSMLPLDLVPLLYSVRWQIELVFKLWKSYAKLNRVAGIRQERIMTELYAKMIGLVLTHFLVAPLRFANQREISPPKVRQILRRFARDLIRHLAHWPAFLSTLTLIFQTIHRFGCKNKRKKRPNTCQQLALASQTCALLFDF